MKGTRLTAVSALVASLAFLVLLSQAPTAIAQSGPIADPNGPYQVAEGDTIQLNGENSENAETYDWSITNDPTGEAYLTQDSTATPTFHAPPEVEDNETISVMLTIANDLDTHSETAKIVVKPAYIPPNPPLNLEVEGKSNPENVTDPKPSFSSEYDTMNAEPATKAQIQVGTNSDENDKWDHEITGLSLSEGERLSITYGGSTLSPQGTYYWRMRFYDRGWGSWSDGSDQFTMGGLKDIIEGCIDPGHISSGAQTLLAADASEAASALSEAKISSSAKVMEEAWLVNLPQALRILEEMDASSRADLLIEISTLPSSPEDAAEILQTMTAEHATETVEAIIDKEAYSALNSIFESSKLFSERIDRIVEGLSKERKKKLAEHLSSNAKERISPELLPREGINWFMIAGILAAAGVIFVLLWIKRGTIRKVIQKPSKPRKETARKKIPSERKWLELIRNFLKSGRRQSAVKTNLPPEQTLKRTEAAIRKLGKQNVVKTAKSGGRVYLLRKAKGPKPEWVKLIQQFLASEEDQKLIKTKAPAGRARKALDAAIRKLGKQNAVRAIEENGIVYLVKT